MEGVGEAAEDRLRALLIEYRARSGESRASLEKLDLADLVGGVESWGGDVRYPRLFMFFLLVALPIVVLLAGYFAGRALFD